MLLDWTKRARRREVAGAVIREFRSKNGPYVVAEIKEPRRWTKTGDRRKCRKYYTAAITLDNGNQQSVSRRGPVARGGQAGLSNTPQQARRKMSKSQPPLRERILAAIEFLELSSAQLTQAASNRAEARNDLVELVKEATGSEWIPVEDEFPLMVVIGDCLISVHNPTGEIGSHKLDMYPVHNLYGKDEKKRE